MSEIAPIALVTPSLPIVEATPGPPLSSQTNDKASSPSDTVSLSSDAIARSHSSGGRVSLGSLSTGQVDNALSWASGANGFAWLYIHADWKEIEARFGPAIAARDKAGALGAALGSATDALSYASGFGIPIKDSVNPDTVKAGGAPGVITVGAFSFTSGGSTYDVTPGKDGTLVGTKDGQAWKTWQLFDPSQAGSSNNDASIALATLKTVTEPKKASDAVRHQVDVSA